MDVPPGIVTVPIDWTLLAVAVNILNILVPCLHIPLNRNSLSVLGYCSQAFVKAKGGDSKSSFIFFLCLKIPNLFYIRLILGILNSSYLWPWPWTWMPSLKQLWNMSDFLFSRLITLSIPRLSSRDKIILNFKSLC